MSTPSVEVEISTKEASMVMEPSIGQAVESVCCSPLLTQTDGQDWDTNQNNFHCWTYLDVSHR